MFRWLVVCVLLCAGTFGLVSLVTGNLFGDGTKNPPSQVKMNPANGGGQERENPAPPPEEKRGTAEVPPGIAEKAFVFNDARDSRSQVLIVQDAHIMSTEKTLVPSEHDGKLMAVGTPLKEGEQVGPDQKVYPVETAYLAVEAQPGDKPEPGEPPFFKGINGKTYRAWREKDPMEPGKLLVAKWPRRFRKLDVGDKVQAGQILAQINPQIAVDELGTKVAKLGASEAERRASGKTKDEAQRRYMSMRNQEQRVPGSVSQDDLQGALLSWHRYTEEEIAKNEAVLVAQRELNATLTTLNMHEIKSLVTGEIRVIYKNRGDAVKNLEPVLEVQNLQELRVEGLMEEQETHDLRKGQTVWIEPTRPVSPLRIISGHLGEVTCVAVARGKEPVIVSGSEDRTLRGWTRGGKRLFVLPHGSSVRAVATSPATAKNNLVLTGAADGTGRLLDLDNLKEAPVMLAERHTGPINCVAFSPDGQTCATGGEDRMICLWDTATGKMKHRIPAAHSAPVTSLQFASDSQLVSAGGKSLTVWNLAGGRPMRDPNLDFEQRGGDVARLGVSPDGKMVLFDQGKEIRLLSLADKGLEGVVQNFAGARPFTTLALFAPDGKTILTNGGAEGRLQLWRSPAGHHRAAELRQFVWNSGAVNGAAFAPDGSFAVVATQDQKVLVYDMPKAEEVESRLTGQITYVEKALDNSSRQVRVWAVLKDVPEWLTPGGTATMVIEPAKK
jgi:WD40 repeat protein/biotin carboxyl carrier protein